MVKRDKLINDVSQWNEKHRYKVNDSVVLNGVIYQNVTGFNSEPTTLTDWKVIVEDFTSKQDIFDSYVIVETLEQLPSPTGNIITLADNTAYLFVTNIDLIGNRFVCGENTVIMGTSSENVRITSTGLLDYLITSEYSIPIRNITFEADKVFDLQGDGVTTAIDWFAVNVQNSNEIGYIKDYSNVIISDSAFINSGNLVFDGTIGTIGINGSILSVANSLASGITISSTCTLARRFRVTYSAIIVGTGANGLVVDFSATIPSEGYILDTVNFSGAGTYLNGFDYTFNEALFVNNKGIQNTRVLSNITMNGNATPTVIGATDTPVKVLGTTVNNTITQKFNNSASNKMVYTGAFTRLFKVTCVCSIESTNNNVIGIYIAKNGIVIDSSEVYGTANASSRAENITCQTLVELDFEDFIEIYVENSTNTNDVTVTSLNVIID